jgi:hypothetical protein
VEIKIQPRIYDDTFTHVYSPDIIARVTRVKGKKTNRLSFAISFPRAGRGAQLLCAKARCTRRYKDDKQRVGTMQISSSNIGKTQTNLPEEETYPCSRQQKGQLHRRKNLRGK